MALTVGPVQNPTLVKSAPIPQPKLSVQPVKNPILTVPWAAAPAPAPRPVVVSTPRPQPIIQQPWTASVNNGIASAVNNRGPAFTQPLQGNDPSTHPLNSLQTLLNGLPPLWQPPLLPPNDPRALQNTNAPTAVTKRVRELNGYVSPISPTSNPYTPFPFLQTFNKNDY